jgi:primosomal protein N' (replication factor Y) (superfamily II helicase)
MRALRVALLLPLPPMSYLPPLGEEGRAPLGLRVAVPWRGEVRVGVVVGEEEVRAGPGLRHAIAYLDQKPYLREEEIRFAEEAARYLFAPLGQVLADFLPPFPELKHRVRLYPGADPKVLPPGLEGLSDWQEARGFDPKLLDLLREAGVLEEEVAFKEGKRVLLPLKEDHPDPELSRALRRLREMGHAESLAAWARATGLGVRRLKRLLEEGYVGYGPPPEARGEEGRGGAPLPAGEARAPERGAVFREAKAFKGVSGPGEPPGPLPRGEPPSALSGLLPRGQGLPRGAFLMGKGGPF